MTHDIRYAQPFPLYMSHGSGPRKWDVDGNEYIDYICGHGALLLGHSHPAIADAVARQVVRGTHLGASTDEELRWAKAIKALMPSVEKVRFHSSGTEATLMAMRLARAYTDKSKVIKLQHHFHGWHDYAMAARLKQGLNETVARMEVSGHAHGIASMIHLVLADCDCDREVCTMPHREIRRTLAAPAVTALKRGLQNNGVDIMDRDAFLVSASHSETDIDQTLAAFENTLAKMRAEVLV